MKLTLFTYCLPNYQGILDLVKPNKDEYCQRHGYQHVAKVGPYWNAQTYYGWQSHQFTLDMFYDPAKVGLAESPDIIWVLNVQSVITNITKPITDYLTDDTKDFWIAKDVGGLNGGSFVIRKSDWSKRWFEFIMSKEPEYRHDCWASQRVMQHRWEDPEWKDKICIAPQNQFNSFDYCMYPPWNHGTPGDWRPGDLVLSFPGTTLERRYALVTEALQNRVTR